MPYKEVSQRKVKDLAPGIHTRTFWGENLLAGVVDLDANAILPEHAHPHEQITFVVSGELHFVLAGEKRTLHPGDLVVIPGGVPHSAIVGPENVKVLDVFSPCREDMQYPD